MQEFFKIFGSDPAVALAWVCTVFSCVYAVVQKNNTTKVKLKFDTLNITHSELMFQNISLQQKFGDLEISYSELKIQNTFLEQKIIGIENNDIHDNYQEVHQNGQNNFNQGVIKGDFNYNK
jgi:hypothetical protein